MFLFQPRNYLILLACLLFAAIAYSYSSPEGRPIFATDTDESDACYMAQKFVRDELKAPATAKFAPCREPDSVVSHGDGRVWQVQSWVDAENGFGANLRNHFRVQMVYHSDTDAWTIMSIRFTE